MLRQVVCPYVRATPSLQGTQLYLLAKVIIFHQFSTFLCLLFEGQQGDYLWNWTVGDVNINSFMWYGGYSYSTYSYIDFTQKYIYLNGYIDSSVEQQSVNVYGVW